jgi:hypothetical protein
MSKQRTKFMYPSTTIIASTNILVSKIIVPFFKVWHLGAE